MTTVINQDNERARDLGHARGIIAGVIYHLELGLTELALSTLRGANKELSENAAKRIAQTIDAA